jgi:hypothetical protein
MAHNERLRDRVRDAASRIAVDGGAWHSLVEQGPAALPYILEVLEASRDRDQRLALVSVINEYRTPEALEFFAGALRSTDDEMWKLALDGLVTLGGSSTRSVLADSLDSVEPTKKEWIVEALEQIE